MIIWTIAKNSWVDQLRNRFYYLIILFGGVLLYVSLLVGVLAVEQELRVLLDLGLALIELLTLIAAIFVTTTSILREMERKTIYLILTRPVSRLQYLLGRFFGLLISVACAMALMGLVHLSVLLAKGWKFDLFYPLVLFYSLLKVWLICSLSMLLALYASSTLTAMSITLILWLLGHFGHEIAFLVKKSAGIKAALLQTVSYIMPNMTLFNLREVWQHPDFVFSWSVFGASVAYALLYSSACLFLSQRLFNSKEL
ncbi:MAG: ABC transporter permease subunit [Elusimicrobia bacterium]|nr:ABC transporter permease subunit [Elusimicrobiota bacterium]